MTIHKATKVGTAGLDIAYERLGDPADPPVLLIMGLGAQLIGWPDGFLEELLRRRLQVIRFDNRDVGESTHLHDAPAPDMAAAMRGDLSSVAYRLSDMAADAVGLLDALGIESAHVVGVSLGGFVAQTMAIEHPRRVRSLTSMSSTTGAPDVGHTHPDAFRAFGGAPPTTREAVVDRTLQVLRAIGSPGYPLDEDGAAERAGRGFDRAFDPLGPMRQGLAVIASGDRTPRLRELDVPALVMHGAEDRMWNVSGGRATAAAIRGAELVVFEGMGHDLPRALWPRFADEIAKVVARGEATSGAAAGS